MGYKMGVLVALNQPITDAIKSVGRDIAMQIAAMAPVSIDETSVPAEISERELAIGREQALALRLSLKQ
jgi:elongation factor Ts